MVVPLSYFLFQPFLHDRYNKGCDMRCPVYGLVLIKIALLQFEKCIPSSSGSGFPRSLSEWSFTIIISNAI